MVTESPPAYVSGQSIQTFTGNLATRGSLNLHSFTSETAPDNVDPHEEIVRMMQVVGRPPIIVLGTIGNLLTFITYATRFTEKSVDLFLHGDFVPIRYRYVYYRRQRSCGEAMFLQVCVL